MDLEKLQSMVMNGRIKKFVNIEEGAQLYSIGKNCFIVGHVHDELIIECSPGVSMDAVCEHMGRTPPWVPGLILNATGFEAEHYKKDD